MCQQTAVQSRATGTSIARPAMALAPDAGAVVACLTGAQPWTNTAQGVHRVAVPLAAAGGLAPALVADALLRHSDVMPKAYKAA